MSFFFISLAIVLQPDLTYTDCPICLLLKWVTSVQVRSGILAIAQNKSTVVVLKGVCAQSINKVTIIMTFTAKLSRSISVTIISVALLIPSALTFAAANNPGVLTVGAQTGTLTAGAAGSATYTLSTTGNGNGTVTWSVGALPLNVSASFVPNTTPSGNTPWVGVLTLTTNASAVATAGTSFTITATGDGSLLTSNTGTLVIAAALLPQTITPVAVPAKTYGDADFALTYTASSGLPVTYTPTTPTVCTIAGSTVHIVAAGNCSFNADQAGNGTYAPAPQVPTTVVVAKKNLTVAGLSVTPKTYDGTPSIVLGGVPAITGLVGADVVTPFVGSFADKHVGVAKPVTVTMTGPATSNYTLTQPGISTDITKLDISITANDLVLDTKIYDGLTSIGAQGVPSMTFSPVPFLGDTVTLTAGTAVLSSKNVGVSTTTFSGYTLGGGDAGNYNLLNQPITEAVTISQAPITVSAVASTKVYDGNTTSAGVPIVTAGALALGDSFSAITQTYGDKNVAGSPAKVLTPTATISDGNGGANYTLTLAPVASGTITPKALTVAGAVVTPKLYDKTTPALLDFTGASLVGVVSPDVVTFSGGTGTYDNSNAGVGKTVSVTGITTTDTNYSITQPTLTGIISPRPITVTATVNTKVYDATVTAAAVPTITVGALQGVDSAVLTEAYATKTVGAGNKVIVPTAVITDGNGGANYIVTPVNNTVSTITPAPLTVTATGVNKVYDGTTNATVTFADDRIAGDIFTVSGTASFADKFVANGKPVSVTGIAIAGTDAGNYSLTATTAATTANITPKNLTIVPTVPGKVYDTTTGATVTYTDNRLAGDTIGITGTAAFGDKNAGPAKTVVLSPVSLFGPDAVNYTVVGPATTTAPITPAPLTASFTASNKVYDATTSATILTRTVTPIIGLDVVTVTGGTATFANKNVGTGKTVSATGLVLGGADGSNYAITTTNTTTADITAKTLVVTATGNNKVYDGTTNATVTFADDRIGGDVFTVSGTASFADKHVAAAKPVSVSGIALTGTDAGNYSANTTATTTANITALPITVTASTNTKVYDATTTAAAVPTITSVGTIQTGDSAVMTETYDNKNVAGSPTKVLTPAIVIADGHPVLAGSNYAVTYVTDSTGVITVAPLTVTFTSPSKTYDGTTTAGITTRSVASILGAPLDDVSAAGGTAVFSTKNAGAGLSVTGTGFTLTGVDAGNYAITGVNTATASISTRALTVATAGVDKVYDGTDAALVTFSDDRVAGDVLSFTGTSTFSDKNVGAGKTVTTNSIVVSGTDANNYSANTVATTTANITQKALLVTATGVNKVQDGTTTATVTLSDDRVAGDVLVLGYGAANFDSALPGTGKTVSVTGITVTGVDAGNYLANTTATTTANILDNTNGPVYGGSGSGSGYIGGTTFGGTSAAASTPSSTNPFAVSTTGAPSAPTVLAQGGQTRVGIVAGASTFKFNINMRVGSRIVPDVTELQKVLIAKGYLAITAPTGVFGTKTLAAVKAYQAANGVQVTGYVGPLTRAKLNAGL